MLSRKSAISALSVVLSLFLTNFVHAQDEYFSIKDGELERPTGYRTWVYVGTPVTPNDMNGGAAPFPEFHSVYIDPKSYEVYQKTGKFRDGTILIKELVSVGSKAAVSGSGYFMGDFIGLEATIKSKKHFPDEPGNWAYFSFTNDDGEELEDYAFAIATQTCNACHAAAAADDFVFTQYYPVLRAAKNTLSSSGIDRQELDVNDLALISESLKSP